MHVAFSYPFHEQICIPIILKHSTVTTPHLVVLKCSYTTLHYLSITISFIIDNDIKTAQNQTRVAIIQAQNTGRHFVLQAVAIGANTANTEASAWNTPMVGLHHGTKVGSRSAE